MVKSITIKIGDTEFVLTLEEARELKQDLDSILAPSIFNSPGILGGPHIPYARYGSAGSGNIDCSDVSNPGAEIEYSESIGKPKVFLWNQTEVC